MVLMNSAIDTATLAQRLGVTSKTVLTRAKALGLSPVQATQGGGRPKSLWSPEQASAIAGYGKNPEPQPLEDMDELEGTAAITAYGALHQSLAMPLGQQLTAYNSQLEALEDQAAIAMAHRTRQVLPRALAKAAAILNSTPDGFSLSDIAAGALGSVSLTPTPLPQALTRAQLSSYLDNL